MCCPGQRTYICLPMAQNAFNYSNKLGDNRNPVSRLTFLANSCCSLADSARAERWSLHASVIAAFASKNQTVSALSILLAACCQDVPV